MLEALQEGNISLLDSTTMSISVVDEYATLLEVLSHFCFVDETIRFLLQTINNEMPIKTVLPIV
ncbi:hypothetical protein [Bartonella refiksaydamii]|uniref:hypothetical protein n=1 Tax=Bartonella refiksaydamii TaxID=2654951 RepID=UPI001FEF0B07|nr:hypothetical protein [Bartonella refiksaydamii]